MRTISISPTMRRFDSQSRSRLACPLPIASKSTGTATLKSNRRVCAALLALLASLLAPLFANAGPATRAVFTDSAPERGSDGPGRIWVGLYASEAGSAKHFYLFHRDLFGPDGWHQPGTLDTPVLGMTHQGKDVV